MLNPNQTPLPRPHFEEDIPNENSTISYDGRFNPTVSGRNIGNVQPQTVSGTTYDSLKRNPTYQTGTMMSNENFNAANYPEGTIVSEKIISSEPIPSNYSGPKVLQPTIVNMATQKVAPITEKDIRTVEKHVPFGSAQPTQVPITNIAQTVPSERLLAAPATTTITRGGPVIGAAESMIYNPSTTITAPITERDIEIVQNHVPFGGPTVQTTTFPAQVTTVTRTQTLVQPQFIPLDGVSEIAPIDDNYMRNSIAGRPSETQSQLSRWQDQKSELASMRYQNHQTFENWEGNRRLFFNDRINIMDDLLLNMEKRLDWLEVGAQKVILFFKERETQEVEYSRRVKHGLTQLGDHFSRSDNPIAMSEFSAGMMESDAFHAREKQNSEIMGGFIKKDILDWILIPAEKEYKLQANSLRTPLNTMRRRITSVGNKRDRRYNKYFKAYDGLQKSSKLEKNEGDLFRRQLKYSLSAREELRLLRLYNEQGIVVINEFSRLATRRMAEIQRAFSLYLQKYMELYQNTATPPGPILDMVERSNPEAVTALFLPPIALLSPSNQQFMATQLGRSSYGYADMAPFLVNFPESIDPARSSFVSREWDAIKLGNLLKRDKACTVVATIGSNLMIIEKRAEESELGRIKHPFQMRYTKVEDVLPNSDGTVLTVVERAPGTLFQHKTKAKLKFETPEEAQDFLQYVSTSQPTQGFVNQSLMQQPIDTQSVAFNPLMTPTRPVTINQPITTMNQQILNSQTYSSQPVTTNYQPISGAQPILTNQTYINNQSQYGVHSPITRNI